MSKQDKLPSERAGGRPRSEETRQTILSAALDLAKDEAVQAVTIEAIARTAGVSKATIYRWWDSKASIIIDAFVEHHVIRTKMPRDVHPVEALVRHWRSLVEQYADWPGRVVAQILAEGQFDPAVLREFRERFHYGRRAVVGEVAKELIGRCSLAGKISAEELMDMYYGPVYMRLIWRHVPLDDEFMRKFPVSFFASIGFEIDEDGKVISDRS
jgi:AcrR family transcriptional regulator